MGFLRGIGISELRLGRALETPDTPIAERNGGSFDFAFIDADQSNDANYYECALALVRQVTRR